MYNQARGPPGGMHIPRDWRKSRYMDFLRREGISMGEFAKVIQPHLDAHGIEGL
jgi:hypothetical protein